MRKRVPRSRIGSRSGGVKKDPSPEQLAGIGAVAIIWNEIEYDLDLAIGNGVVIHEEILLHVTSRWGFDAKNALLYEIAEEAHLPEATLDLIDQTCKALRDYKNQRDAVVHARILHAPTGVGETIRRGAQFRRSLLTTEALDDLYERLDVLRSEMDQIVQIFYAIRRAGHFAFRDSDDEERRLLQQESIRWTDEAHS